VTEAAEGGLQAEGGSVGGASQHDTGRYTGGNSARAPWHCVAKKLCLAVWSTVTEERWEVGAGGAAEIATAVTEERAVARRRPARAEPKTGPEGWTPGGRRHGNNASPREQSSHPIKLAAAELPPEDRGLGSGDASVC